MRKPYPINGWEQEICYSRKYHNYRSGEIKFLKRKMNKRFRKPQNIIEIKEYIYPEEYCSNMESIWDEDFYLDYKSGVIMCLNESNKEL